LIIRCEQCTTAYHLDEKLIEPFGSKVRCTRCGHIFWAEPPSFSRTTDFQDSPLKGEPFPAFMEEEEAAALQMKPSRLTRWVLAGLGLLVLLALAGRFFYVQYSHPGWGQDDIWSTVFFLPADPEGNRKISLINIKKHFKESQKAGRFFIIEGEVKNGYPDLRQKVKIRATLRTADNRVAASREAYAGWTLTPEELEALSPEELNRPFMNQPDRFSPNIRILPGKTLPFMILFPPLPPGSTQVSIEVVGSEKFRPAAPVS
jgi:predicted Zn finger-like uncharacterized protein